MTTTTFVLERTVLDRKYFDGPEHVNGDECVRQRYFTYPTAEGLVAGVAAGVMFTIDRPAKAVWTILKDFNLWQNEHRHYYSGALDQLEGKTFRLSKVKDEAGPHYYEVLKVVPEYMIVINQPVPSDGSSAGFPGLGGVSPGFHVFLLNEFCGKTTVSIYMEHSSRTVGTSEHDALQPWRNVVESAWFPKWRDHFVRTLKRLVYSQPAS